MILDDLFAAIFGAIIEGTTALVEPLVNLIIAAIELVVGLFIPDFRMGRMKRKRKYSNIGIMLRVLPMFLILGLICWLFVIPSITERTITFVAKDGHSLTYAGLIIHSEDGDKHRRTDRQGEITFPRNSTRAITLKDARYVEQTWQKSEFKDRLTARRTVLGAGLDKFGEILRKPAEGNPDGD
jgi:hypothetical protein